MTVRQIHQLQDTQLPASEEIEEGPVAGTAVAVEAVVVAESQSVEGFDTETRRSVDPEAVVPSNRCYTSWDLKGMGRRINCGRRGMIGEWKSVWRVRVVRGGGVAQSGLRDITKVQIQKS